MGNFLYIPNQFLDAEMARSEEFRREMGKAVDEGAEWGRNNAPRRTGAMADSIKSLGVRDIGGKPVGEIIVGEGAPHWAYVEYGTGQRGASSPQPDPGVEPGYRHGPSAGMPAQPFMRPILWWIRNRIGF